MTEQTSNIRSGTLALRSCLPEFGPMQTLAAGAARAQDSAGESDLPSRPATGALPESLHRLLSAEASASDAEWEEFVAEFSFLLLHVARRLARDRDEGMDLYAHVLEVLRADNCQRLRAYAVHPDSKFTTWLVVVARRICHDRHRAKYVTPRPVRAGMACA